MVRCHYGEVIHKASYWSELRVGESQTPLLALWIPSLKLLQYKQVHSHYEQDWGDCTALYAAMPPLFTHVNS